MKLNLEFENAILFERHKARIIPAVIIEMMLTENKIKFQVSTTSPILKSALKTSMAKQTPVILAGYLSLWFINPVMC